MNENKKNSELSVIAFVMSILGCLGIVGIILGIVDLAKHDETKKHGLSTAAIVIPIIYFFLFMFIGILSPSIQKYVEKNRAATEESINTSDSEKETEEATEEVVKDNKIRVGEKYEENGFEISLDEVKTEDITSSISTPENGNKYVSATFTYTNNSNSSQYVSIYDFNCYADNSVANQAFIGTDGFMNTNLSEGRNVTITVYYEVPEDSKEIELEYSGNIFSSKIDAVFVIAE